MNADWQACLRAQGARIEENCVRDFGDPEGELAAAREASIAAPLTPFALIECAGPDAATFLHNQLTSDVKHLLPEAAQHAAWCSPKGRMLASFVLFRHGENYRALVSGDLVEFVLKRLSIYILRSKASLADRSAEHEIIGVGGPRSADALQNAGLDVPAAAMSTRACEAASVIRLDEKRHVVIAARDAAPELWRRLCAAAAPAGAPAWQWLDVAAGLPWIVQATQEAFVPQMAGFDRIGGVSFDKGCYPGQEIVARARYLGQVKRRLYRVHADGPVSAGMPVFTAGTPEPPRGQIASAAPAPGGGWDALAVILEEAASGGGEIRAALPRGGSVGLSQPDPVFPDPPG